MKGFYEQLMVIQDLIAAITVEPDDSSQPLVTLSVVWKSQEDYNDKALYTWGFTPKTCSIKMVN